MITNFLWIWANKWTITLIWCFFFFTTTALSPSRHQRADTSHRSHHLKILSFFSLSIFLQPWSCVARFHPNKSRMTTRWAKVAKQKNLGNKSKWETELEADRRCGCCSERRSDAAAGLLWGPTWLAARTLALHGLCTVQQSMVASYRARILTLFRYSRVRFGSDWGPNVYSWCRRAMCVSCGWCLYCFMKVWPLMQCNSAPPLFVRKISLTVGFVGWDVSPPATWSSNPATNRHKHSPSWSSTHTAGHFVCWLDPLFWFDLGTWLTSSGSPLP